MAVEVTRTKHRKALRVREIFEAERGIVLVARSVLRVACSAPPVDWLGSGCGRNGKGILVAIAVIAVEDKAPFCGWRVGNHGVLELPPVVVRFGRSAEGKRIVFWSGHIVLGYGPHFVGSVREAHA